MDSNTMVIIVLLREAIPPRKNPNRGGQFGIQTFCSVHVCTFFRKGVYLIPKMMRNFFCCDLGIFQGKNVGGQPKSKHCGEL